MRKTGWRLAAIAIGVAAAFVCGPAPAEASTCETLRQSVVNMETNAAKPPGYAAFRRHLLLTALACRDVPPPVPVDVSHCPSSGNESMCTLLAQAHASCKAPERGSRMVCEMLFGPGWELGANAPRPPATLPPTLITLDGRVFQIDTECSSAMYDLWEPDERAVPGSLRARTARDPVTRMKESCPDFLAALEQRTGRNASSDPTNFRPALGDLLMSNFGPRGAPPISALTFKNDAGFQARCAEARRHENTCLQRQANMGPVGQESRGTRGQAGAFGECAALYGAFRKMCGSTDQAAAREAARPAPTPPPPQAPPQQSTVQPGARQPASLTGLSTTCRAQLNQALEAADRGDSARATQMYGVMRSSGCEEALRGLSSEVQTGLPERQMGNLSSQWFRQECVTGDCGARAPSTPGESARAAENAFDPMQVMEFLFAIGGLAVTAAGYYTPSPGGMMVQSNRFTTINQRARSTYGYGGPVYAPGAAPNQQRR